MTASVCRRPPTARRWKCAVTIFASCCLCGCADSGIWLVLETLAGDDPYHDMRQIEVTVTRDDKTVESYRGPFYGGEVELDSIPRSAGLILQVDGLDLEAHLVARGRAEPEMPERAGTCCVRMCFCSVALFETGDCRCGANECRDTCVDAEE